MAKAKNPKESKKSKRKPKAPGCGRAAAKVAAARRTLEREEKRLRVLREREEERIAKRTQKVLERQAREGQKLKARHELELKKLDIVKVCAPPKKRTRSKKAAKKAPAKSSSESGSPRAVVEELTRGARIEAAEHGFDVETALVVAADHLKTDLDAYKGKKVPRRRVTRPPSERLPVRPPQPRTAASPRAPKRRAAAPSYAVHFLAVPRVEGELRVACDGAAFASALRVVRRLASNAVALVAAEGGLFAVGVGDHPEGGPWIVARVDAQVARPGTFWLRKSDLVALVAVKGQVHLTEEVRVLSVESAAGRHVITSNLPGSLPRDAAGSAVLWDAALLKTAIETTIPFFEHNDKSRENLRGMFVDGAGEDTAFVGTDGHRLVKFVSSLPSPGERALWPADTVHALHKGLDAGGPEVQVQVGASMARIAGVTKGVPWTITFRVPKRDYPPYERVIPASQDFSCSVQGHHAAQALEPLVNLAKSTKEKLPKSAWSLTRDNLVIRSGEHSASLPLTCGLPAGRQGAGIGLNPVYVHDVLALPAFRDTVTFSMNLPPAGKTDTLDPLRLDASGDRWQAVAVIMPQRL